MGGKGGKVLYTFSTVGLEDVSGFGAVGAAYRPTSSHVCRSTFSSSPDSPSCSLRSGWGFSTSLVWSSFPLIIPWFSFLGGSSESGSRSSSTIGWDLLFPALSIYVGSFMAIPSSTFELRFLPRLKVTAPTWRRGLVSVLPGRSHSSLFIAIAICTYWLSNRLICSLMISNLFISSQWTKSIFPPRLVAIFRFPVKASSNLDLTFPLCWLYRFHHICW